MFIGLAFLLAVTSSLLTLARSTEAGSSPRTRFIAHSCPFKVSGGPFRRADVRCGFVEVPEDWHLAKSTKIKLATAVFKHHGGFQSSDPLVFLAGGPGGAIVKSLGASIAASGTPIFAGNRDLILVDQRGAGLSQPSLACPEFDNVGVRPAKAPLLPAAIVRLDHAALQRCRSRLVRAGIHLNDYNTVQNADDIAALRTTLGYKTVDVYGGSYGSILALQVMRDHPAGIRSVVIDAVAPLPFNEYNDTIPNAWRSIRLVFAQCRSAASCNERYPHLDATFDRLVARLQAHPVALHLTGARGHFSYPVAVTGASFTDVVMEALYSASYIPLIPKLIADTARGRYELLRRAAQALIVRAQPQSKGMYFSMMCADDQASSSPSKIAGSARALPAAIRSAVVAAVTDELTRCRIWHVASVSARNRQFFSSNIPTLLLEGEFDPRTPPSGAVAMAKHLRHSYYFLYPGLGHGVVSTGTCPDLMVATFLEVPTRKPVSSCIGDMRHAFG
jgi:pimeloyl-ACP methyl ester carboxylesterase